ncbi:MAG TPA: [Fe-Fe] hydrogenase large subunit C-terminal domain-containing protein [Tepidisphaeraceae bacterium]|nr:[Fe-Fe] hydrogenase large subunit C-terminal domain-containing protein [Tepidisphaeraceae bacterium]
MDFLNPIYTEKRECQDCYKCVRNCPVKAIKVEAGCATVISELCILCGQCVEVCPNEAKRVRDDLPRAKQQLALKKQVIVSLAPSYVAEFPGIRSGQIIHALRKLGFFGVSETALGAQQVSAHVAAMFREQPQRILLSSACPTVVAYLQKHRAAYSQYMTGLLSPVLTHCAMLRNLYGPELGIVFISPCIAKKAEADAHPELLDVALTFEDLRRWLEQEHIDLEKICEGPDDALNPEAAREGAIYPIDGGMVAGIRADCSVTDCSLMSFSGISTIQRALSGLEQITPEHGLFIELLACEGGCINGPKVGHKAQTACKRFQLLQRATYPTQEIPRKAELPINQDLRVAPVIQPQFTDFQIREALRIVGKFTVDDEINCGGCGYDSCREFGKALLLNKAERSMCVTYMRKLAHKKANALIQKMPSAVVIVDESLKILEYNASLAQLLARNGNGSAQNPPSLEGTLLSSLVPFHNLFASVLKTGEDIMDKDLRYRETILHISIFTIEKHCVVGGIIQDITKPAVQREQVIKRAQEVIQRNLSTVQKIAYLLGENAAESEITLNSIIDSFSPPKIEETGEDSDWRKLYRR